MEPPGFQEEYLKVQAGRQETKEKASQKHPVGHRWNEAVELDKPLVWGCNEAVFMFLVCQYSLHYKVWREVLLSVTPLVLG